MEPTLAVILADGPGERMGILCHHRAKPLLPFAGTAHLIDFTMSNCIHSHIQDIAVLTDYQWPAITSYFNEWSTVSSKAGNLRLLKPNDGSYLGATDAVYQNIGYLERHNASLVMVLAGDHIYKMDYQRMLAFHMRMRADVTVGVVTVPIEQAHRFDMVTTDDSGRMVRFSEKPELSQSNLASMDIYVFNKHVLIKCLAEDAQLPYSPHDFRHAIMPRIVRRDKVAAYWFDSYWQDIDTPQAYYESNMELLNPKPSFSLNGILSVPSGSNHVPPARKSQEGSIENSLVSPGCVIKGRVENSILSPNVWVEENAEIRNSIVMANSFIGYHSVVNQCILDEGVNVGKFCYLGLGGTGTSENWNITVLGEGVTVPPHTAIGHNCTILPHVGPDDFRGSVVPSDSIMSPRSVTKPRRINEKKILANI